MLFYRTNLYGHFWTITLKLTFGQLELAKLETLRIKKLLDEELQKTFDPLEGQNEVNNLKQEDFVYFYCWTIEQHFFGLIQNSIQNENILSGHQRFYLG